MSIGFKISARIAQDGHTELFYPVKRPMPVSYTHLDVYKRQRWSMKKQI